MGGQRGHIPDFVKQPYEAHLSKTNVHIRPYQPDDAPQVYQAVQESLEEVSLWLPDLNPELTLEEIRAYIRVQPERRAEKMAFNFAIVDKQAGTFLGGCGLTLINWLHRFANLYYWVRSSHTGQGIASSATLLLAKYGFDELGLQRIEIIVAVDNAASLRVAEKVGAVQEGLLRKRIHVHGAVHDAYLYSLIPGDV
jgi:RimJ/RimL family protein N-acetyltransferase